MRTAHYLFKERLAIIPERGNSLLIGSTFSGVRCDDDRAIGCFYDFKSELHQTMNLSGVVIVSINEMRQVIENHDVRLKGVQIRFDTCYEVGICDSDWSFRRKEIVFRPQRKIPVRTASGHHLMQ